jgi:hypothetical protein
MFSRELRERCEWIAEMPSRYGLSSALAFASWRSGVV